MSRIYKPILDLKGEKEDKNQSLNDQDGGERNNRKDLQNYKIMFCVCVFLKEIKSQPYRKAIEKLQNNINKRIS